MKIALSALTALVLSSVVALAAPAAPVDKAAGEVLARLKAATGGAAWDAVRTVHTRGTIETGGLSGTGESWEEVTSGRSATRYDLGPVKGAEGYDGKVAWSMDDSGQVVDQEGPEAREAQANESYRQAMAYWYPGRGEAVITHQGETTGGERTFDRVRIVPKGGRPFDLWVDRKTGLLDRQVEKTGAETRTTFFSDYRDVQGLKVPFVSRSTNGEVKYDQVVKVNLYEVNGAFDEAVLRRPEGRSNDYGIAGGSTSVTVPIELINNHIYVQVSFDGRPATPVLFDTGGVNVLVPAAVERLGLKSEGKLQGRGAGEGSEDLGLTKVKELRIGDLFLRDQSFFVLPLHGLDRVEGVPINGLIGFEVFKRFVVRIDYAGKRATFTLPDAFHASGREQVVPVTFDGRTPQVQGEIDGVAGVFSIDTGSRASLTLNGPFAEKNGLKAKYSPKLEAMSGWGVGGGVRSALTRVRLLKIGTVEVPGPVADIALTTKGAFANPYLAGNIGGGVLKRFDITFDYGKKRLLLEPNANFSSPDNWDRSGLWLNRADDGFRVEEAVAGGPGAQASLAAGDTITAIDGKQATGISLADLRQRLRDGAPGTAVKMTVRTAGGATREVKVVLRELL